MPFLAGSFGSVDRTFESMAARQWLPKPAWLPVAPRARGMSKGRFIPRLRAGGPTRTGKLTRRLFGNGRARGGYLELGGIAAAASAEEIGPSGIVTSQSTQPDRRAIPVHSVPALQSRPRCESLASAVIGAIIAPELSPRQWV
ncbi:hypothetical protein GCM10022219_09740 [Microbacterium oryzae]